jgi:hypothetical protein
VLPRAQYVAQARAICTAGSKRLRAVERRLFGPPPYNSSTGTLKRWAAWHTAAARFSEEALAKKRLPAVLRRVAAAASAGETALTTRWAVSASAIGRTRLGTCRGSARWLCRRELHWLTLSVGVVAHGNQAQAKRAHERSGQP